MQTFVTKYGYHIMRQSLAQASVVDLRNCFTGAYGFDTIDETVATAMSALRHYSDSADMLLYAEIFQLDTADQETPGISIPESPFQIIIYDPAQRYDRASYFNDPLFPQRYLQCCLVHYIS